MKDSPKGETNLAELGGADGLAQGEKEMTITQITPSTRESNQESADGGCAEGT